MLLLGLIAYGCKSSFYVPTEQQAVQYHQTLGELISGRQLYLSKCSSCHNIYLPDNYSQTQWKNILDKMQERSKISDTEKEKIFNYLLVFAKPE